MTRKYLVATFAATIAVTGALVASTGTANAAPAVYLTDATFGNSVVTEAINVQASGGILTVAPTLDTACVGPTNPIRQDLVHLPLGSLADVKALHGECNIAPRTDLSEAKAKVASIDLLNIDITGVVAKCSITKTGSATCGSVVAQLGGKPLALGPLSIVIPGVAAVYIDHNTEFTNGDGSVTMMTRAVEIDVFPVVSGGVVVRQAEQVLVGQASITSPAPTEG
ncbi:MAG TPA: hypothetical protein VGN35_09215 [Jatrophihabitantaceae bacterium]|jgi:hypothetical protein|nr:hypothetical protein [Jatrophihabitantaceae bacterium]